MFSAEHEKEQAELETQLSEYEQNLQAHEADSVNVDRFMKLAQRYTDFSELTGQHPRPVHPEKSPTGMHDELF